MARIKRLLSDTKNAILAAGALAAAVIAVVAATNTFLSIGHSPTPPALRADIENITLETNVGLDEYEARDQRAELDSPREPITVQTGYLLAAYTAATGTSTTSATSASETETSSPSPSTPGPSPQTTPESKPTTSTGEPSKAREGESEKAPSQTGRSHEGAGQAKQKSTYVYKRTKLSEGAAHDHAPDHNGVTFVKPPSATASFKREGKSQTLTGTGASTSEVEGLLAAASEIAPPTPKSGESPSKSLQAATKVALPTHCDSSCAVAPMIDQILADDSNPAESAKKVATVFAHSRGRFYDHELHPLGANVEYTLKLTGFVHSNAILEWTLWSQSTGRPLPRSWWQSVIVKQVKPSRYEETFSGTFWAPIPPKPGDYVFHLAVYDEHGNRRGHGRTPVFH